MIETIPKNILFAARSKKKKSWKKKKKKKKTELLEREEAPRPKG